MVSVDVKHHVYLRALNRTTSPPPSGVMEGQTDGRMWRPPVSIHQGAGGSTGNPLEPSLLSVLEVEVNAVGVEVILPVVHAISGRRGRLSTLLCSVRRSRGLFFGCLSSVYFFGYPLIDLSLDVYKEDLLHTATFINTMIAWIHFLILRDLLAAMNSAL